MNPVLQSTAPNLLMANFLYRDQPHAQLFDDLCDPGSNDTRCDEVSLSPGPALPGVVQDGVSDLVAPETGQKANHLLEISSVGARAREGLGFEKLGEVRGRETGESSTIRANAKENDSANSDDSTTKDESVHLDGRREGDSAKPSGAFSTADDESHDIWSWMELDPEFQSSDADEVDMGEFDMDKMMTNVDEYPTSPSRYLPMPLFKLPVHTGALDLKGAHARDVLAESGEATSQVLFYDLQACSANSAEEKDFDAVGPAEVPGTKSRAQETKLRYSSRAAALHAKEALSQATSRASRSSSKCSTFPQNREYLERVYESAGATELVLSVVKRELDAEIEMRRKEMEQIEANLAQVKTIWEKLQRIWSTKIFSEEALAHRIAGPEDEASAGRQSKQRSRLSAGLSYLEKSGGQQKKKKKIEPLPQKLLYYRTPSNRFVQLICPACSRELFGNQLGFINHCRMVHQLKFVTLDDAAEVCGKPVDESCVPEDDPSRHEVTLGYFVGQQTMCTQNQVKAMSLTAGQAEFSRGKEECQNGGDQDRASLSWSECSEGRNPNCDRRGGSDGAAISDDVLKQAGVEFSGLHVKKQLLLGDTSKPVKLSSGETLFKWSVYLRPLRGDVGLEEYIEKVRFFLHPSFKPRDIVEISNPPFHLLRESLHLWPVRVQIHFRDPRNKPQSVIHYLTFRNTTLEAPGDESVVDLEIDRNFTQNMKLWSDSGPAWPRVERDEKSNEPFRDEDDRARNKEERAGFGTCSAKCDSGRQAGHHEGGKWIGSANVDEESLKSVVVEQANRTYPLINSDERRCLPYSTAKTEEEWMSWSHAKRKASEWQRARHLRVLLDEKYKIKCRTYQVLELCQHLNLVPPHKQANASSDPFSDPDSYERLYMLPILKARLEEIETLEYKKISKKINYCRYCGCPHLPTRRFDELEQACGEKKIWILEECHSSFEEYLEKTYKWISEENTGPAKQPFFKPLPVSTDTDSNAPADSPFCPSKKFKPRVDASESGLKFPTLDLSVSSTEQKSAPVDSSPVSDNYRSTLTASAAAETPSSSAKADLATSAILNSSDVEKSAVWHSVDPISFPSLPLPTLFNFSSSNVPHTDYSFSPEQVSLLSSVLSESTSPCSLKPKKRGRPAKKATAHFSKTHCLPSASPQPNSPILIQNLQPASPLLGSNPSPLTALPCTNVRYSPHEQSFAPINASPCLQPWDTSSLTAYLPLLSLLHTPPLTFRPYHLDAHTSQLLCPLLCVELEYAGIDLALHPSTQYLLLKLLGCFCRKLLVSSAMIYNEERTRDPLHERKCKVLVGLHVVAAILRDPKNFDFLTSEGLAKYTSRQVIDSGRLKDNPHQAEILNQLAQKNAQHATQKCQK